MYQLTGVSKIYQKGRRTVPAVRDLDLTIGDGEWLAVQGRTGHGKTTLLQLLGGLDRPTSGIVDFDGADLARLREAQVTRVRAVSIGFIFQTFNLVPTLSAAENVEAALIPLGTRLAARRRKVAQALDAVGLGDRARHLPGELSGGQQQRVAIARALVTRPAVVFADEPTGALDSAASRDVLRLLRGLVDDAGLTVIMVTHDPVAAAFADQALFLADGQICDTADRPSADLVATRLAGLEAGR